MKFLSQQYFKNIYIYYTIAFACTRMRAKPFVARINPKTGYKKGLKISFVLLCHWKAAAKKCYEAVFFSRGNVRDLKKERVDPVCVNFNWLLDFVPGSADALHMRCVNSDRLCT